MPQSNQAFADPGYAAAAPNPPPVRTTLLLGQSAPPTFMPFLERDPLAAALIEFDKKAFADKAAETAAARQIAAYVLRLQTESAFEPLRRELEDVQQKLEEATREHSRLHNLGDRMQTLNTQAQIELGRLQRAAERRVPVATATKKVSLVILAFCLFALGIYLSTGFGIVHPFFAIILGSGSFFFYLIGMLMAKDDKLA